MRDDLLEAKASVEWAQSNFPSFKRRLEAWLKINVSLEIKEVDGSTEDDLIVAIQKEALPISFNVEAGAYINTIRSSLDILACALARRHNITPVKDVCFRIAASKEKFMSGKDKLIKGLPSAERSIIENLEPYAGGHRWLWCLHHLDIVRKHRRLLEVDVSPRSFNITMWGNINDHITNLKTGWMRSNDQEIVLALIKKGTPKPFMRLTPHVSFSEPGIGRIPVIEGLAEFAGTAHLIIAKFNST